MANPFFLNQDFNRVAVYPGSFDPIHLGHINIIERICPLFDQVIVLISNSNQKACLFSVEERKKMIDQSLKHLSHIRVDIHSGLTVDYVKEHKNHIIIRGLRSLSDFDFELNMAHMNMKLSPEVETLSMFSHRDLCFISSRAIKEVAVNGGELKGLVPEVIIDPLKLRIIEVSKTKN